MPKPGSLQQSLRAYAMAAGVLLAACALQWALRPVIGPRAPFLFLYPAVGVAALLLGWRPALVVLLGGLVHAVFWLEPHGPMGWQEPGGLTALGGFLLGAGVLVAMGGWMHSLRGRAVLAEERLDNKIRDLQALHELGSRIALLPTLEQQMHAVLQSLCELLGARKGVVCVADGGHSRLLASAGFDESALAELARMPAAQAASVRDTELDGNLGPFRAFCRAQGIRSLQSWPLTHGEGHDFGAITIHYEEPRDSSDRETRLGGLCARMAAVLVERENAIAAATASTRRLQVALETSAVPFCLLQPMAGEAGELNGFRWEYLNAAAARMVRLPAETLLGRPVRDSLTGAELEPGLRRRTLEALQSGQTKQFETWIATRGQKHWFQVIASPYEDGLAVWFADVTKRKQQEDMLREADRRKDEFLATLAHELRNPLAPIRQAALIARSPKASEDQKHWSYEVIERQVGHMALLLDDLLDVSRITRGKLELRKERIPLARVVESALEAARPQIESRGQALTVTLPPHPVWLDADPIRMAQVLINLLGNASKYTQAGGRIRLDAREAEGHAWIEVADNGTGIPPEALDRVFEMFTQVRVEGAAPSSGLGIGLALSRGLVGLHGGTLTAHSDGPGLGSTFTVKLPVAPPPVLVESVPQARRENVRRRRVLVADDNRDAAESLADLLRMEGHDVAVAFDGPAALGEFTRFSPEVALLDIGMPGLTGNEVASEIRSRPEGAGTVLVAITGWGQERDRAAARHAGFDFHFTKPVDPLKVLGLLEEA